MVVTTILLLRHGHRMNWTLDPTTGEYSSSHPYPTKLPADPPLVAHGVRQARETGTYLSAELLPLVQQDRLRVYSSLFYRCLETLQSTVEALRSSTTDHPALTVRGERGIGEWFGAARFTQPVPCSPTRLKRDFFPFIDEQYHSLVIPPPNGERIHQLHLRVAKALEAIVCDVDAEYTRAGRGDEQVTLLLCGHAAQIICAGRALTGQIPDDLDTEDFKCFTCGISKFVRNRRRNRDQKDGLVNGTNRSGNDDDFHRDATASNTDWRRPIISKGGVAGGWTCTLNSWCGHLSQGEERGWHFQGDESFDSYGASSPPALAGSSSNSHSASGSHLGGGGSTVDDSPNRIPNPIGGNTSDLSGGSSNGRNNVSKL